MIPVEDWKWFGHAGHLIVGHYCRYHLCTHIGNYLVSTVGEYWPERGVREVHAQVHDPKWLIRHSYLRGDDFDYAYMKRFGYEDIGCDRKYETMVFACLGICERKGCNCGLPEISGSELDAKGYNEAGDASRGHYELCLKYATL